MDINWRIKMNRIVWFVLLSGMVSLAFGQQSKVLDHERILVDTGGYMLPGFIREKENIMRGEIEALKPLWEKLYRLKKGGVPEEEKVRIVHIGDSHLQAGYLNGTVMRHFHSDFGNSGRGLIVPLKLSKTNEPIDYDIISNVDWKAARCLSKKPPYPVGIGGISIVPRDTVFRIEVQIPASEEIRYRFRSVDIYHLPGAATLLPCEPGVIKEETQWPFITRFRLNTPHSRIVFEGRTSCPDSSVYYGFNLENGNSGVLYHTIGINGAQFIHYLNIDHFEEQVESLHPDLVIFSLGTNEAFRGYFSEEFIRGEMDKVVLEIRRKNPTAVIILTTPAECQWKKNRNGKRVFEPNPYIAPIAETIIKYAREHGLVYWDLFGMSGGYGSSNDWINGNYLSRDRIHFAVSGYRLQGDMLYSAMMKEYNKYVRKNIQQQEKAVYSNDWWRNKVLFPMVENDLK